MAERKKCQPSTKVTVMLAKIAVMLAKIAEVLEYIPVVRAKVIVVPAKAGTHMPALRKRNWIPACSAQPSLQARLVSRADSMLSEFPAAPFAGMTKCFAGMTKYFVTMTAAISGITVIFKSQPN